MSTPSSPSRSDLPPSPAKSKLKIRHFGWPETPEKERIDRGIPMLFERFYDTEVSDDDPDITFLGLPSVYHLLQHPEELDRIRSTRVADSQEFWTSHRDWLSDYTFDYRPTTDRNYYLPLYRAFESYDQLFAPRDPEAALASKRGFCSFMYSNYEAIFPGVVARTNFFKKLQGLKYVNALGFAENNTPSHHKLTRQHVNHMEIKREMIAPYKFDIAFENARFPGYHTEKLTDALMVGSIPIYRGDPDVSQIFNPRAFINVDDFDTMDDAIRWILTVDRNDDLYKSYLAEPPFRDNREPEILNIEPLRARMDEIAHEPRIAAGTSWYYRKKTRVILATPALNPYYSFMFWIRYHPQHGMASVARRVIARSFRGVQRMIRRLRKRPPSANRNAADEHPIQ